MISANKFSTDNAFVDVHFATGLTANGARLGGTGAYTMEMLSRNACRVGAWRVAALASGFNQTTIQGPVEFLGNAGAGVSGDLHFPGYIGQPRAHDVAEGETRGTTIFQG
jgi:hypothetical protein